MFSVPKVNIVASDEGFTVEVLGRASIKYCEDEKALLINSEYLAGPAGIVVYASSIKHWAPPHDKIEINDLKRKNIIDNIRRAFLFSGFNIDIM